MYKLIGLFALVAAVACNDLTVGSGADGKKIYDEKLEASPAIWRQDKNYTVNATTGHVISRVVVTDLREEKNGEAQIVEGGKGYNNVTIELKSPAVFRGFEFNVQVYEVPDNTQQGVSTDLPKSETPKVPENPQVPISVTGEDLDDNFRKTRKTEEQDKDNVTPKLFMNGEASTTSTTTPVHQSIPVSSEPTPISSNPTPVSNDPKPVSSNPTTVPSNPTPVPTSSTPAVLKGNDGQKFNIPIGLGKDIKPEDSSTSTEQQENSSESDIIDPTLVGHQPTHLNNTEKSSTENAKATDKTTERPAKHLGQVLIEYPKRNVRRTEDGTTESDVTTTPTTTGYESTTEVKGSSSSEEHKDSSEIVIPPNFSWDVKFPLANNKDLSPPKTIGSDNVAAQSKQPSMAPLPYKQ